jgi:hypothetical protein
VVGLTFKEKPIVLNASVWLLKPNITNPVLSNLAKNKPDNIDFSLVFINIFF